MPALHELQTAFLETLLAEDVPADAVHSLSIAEVHGSGIDVHRHTLRANLQAALRTAYPVVERLVGEEFFAYAAQAFISRQPSQSSNLEDYGVGFADFLRDFAPAASLPYLRGVAMLEAAIERIARAPDDAATQLLQSPYPVLRIWQVNQPGWSGDDVVDLDAGPDDLRVYREQGEVLIESLGAIPGVP
jgi:hypothetical protein